MRIVFDLQAIQTESRLRGIGRYAKALINSISTVSDDHDLVFVLSDLFPHDIENLKSQLPIRERSEVVVFRAEGATRAIELGNESSRRILEAAFQAFVADLMPDIVLVLSPFEGYVDNAITLRACDDFSIGAVIYDLIPLIQQKDYLTPNQRYRGFYFDIIENIRHFSFSLTISEHARSEIIEHLGFDAARVFNIDGSVNDVFFPDLGRDKIEVIGAERYILYTGGADPRKNLKRLISAYSALPPPIRNQHRLVFAGNVPTGELMGLTEHARQLGLDPQSIVFTGYVSDVTLRQLYSNCTLFVFPSYHEGLGLPVLEAMKCDAPVLVANATSLPELVVLEEAMFDPFDVVDISSKITRVLSDEGLRDRLILNSRMRSPEFSWEKTGRLALAAIESFPTSQRANFEVYSEARDRRYQQLIRCIGGELPASLRGDQKYLRRLAGRLAANQATAWASVRRLWPLEHKLKWRIEGPFDSSYSLALLNRETARALSELGHEIILHSTEGPGDFVPNDVFLKKNPDLHILYDRSKLVEPRQCDVQSRNLYPPRVEDMNGRLSLLHHYAWEESGFPQQWAANFNDYLDGITCLSSHVRKILIDNGVFIPLTTSGCGIDHWERLEAEKKFKVSGKSFKFLHVSSCFPRKGANLLLEAFGQTFTKNDDVSLIIKTFVNPHNEIRAQLSSLKDGNPEFPDVIIIEEDLSDSRLKALYEQCDVLVAPSFAEGFGLPLAEAMLSGIPVITTGWGGQTDFCREDTAWLLDYEFQPAVTHLGISASVWAVPDVGKLSETLKKVYTLPVAERQRKAANGKQLLLAKFRWKHVAERLLQSAQALSRIRLRAEPKIGWVTTWQAKCGIATYSEHILSHWRGDYVIYARRDGRNQNMAGEQVRFTWDENPSEDLQRTQLAIDEDDIDVLVLQLNYGFFEFTSLANFIRYNHAKGRKIVLVLHSTIDPEHEPTRKLSRIVSELSLCDRILVHTHNDLNRLKSLNLVDNVAIFPHGVLAYKANPNHVTEDAFRIATYGFFLPKKGLIETIEAAALLKSRGLSIKLHMLNAEYPNPVSTVLIAKARSRIQQLNLREEVTLTNDFLSDEQSLAYLSEADLLIFPYQSTAESASGAVRYGLAVGRPVAVSPSKIFDDVREAVLSIPGSDPQSIADGIMTLATAIRTNSELITKNATAAAQWREAHLYQTVSHRMRNITKSLWVNDDPEFRRIGL
jgi:glycosyltransferase involved in cell wall biosynthesis